MPNRMGAYATAVGLMFMLCLPTFSSAQQKKDEKSNIIKVGSSPVVSSAGIFIAYEKGYFKEQGLNVEIELFRSSSAPMNTLLAKGELDIGGGNITSGLFNAGAHGYESKIVADKGSLPSAKAGYIALLVRTDLVTTGKYKSAKDLKGLKMAFTALQGTSQEAAAARVLATAGLKIDDIELLKMPYADMNLALRNKSLDATIQIEPYVTMAESDGIAKNMLSVYDVHPGQQSAALFFSPKFAKDRKEDGIRFLVAYIKGVRDYVAAFGGDSKKRAAEITILKKYIDIRSDDVWNKMTPVGFDPDLKINRSALKADLDYFAERKYISSSTDGLSAIDESFLNEALKRLEQVDKNAK